MQAEGNIQPPKFYTSIVSVFLYSVQPPKFYTSIVSVFLYSVHSTKAVKLFTGHSRFLIVSVAPLKSKCHRDGTTGDLPSKSFRSINPGEITW